jgi:hypothetical protein
MVVLYSILYILVQENLNIYILPIWNSRKRGISSCRLVAKLAAYKSGRSEIWELDKN